MGRVAWMNAAPFLVLLSLLQQTATVEEEESSSGDSAFTFRLALEAGPLSLPSGTQGGGQDYFALAVPVAQLTHAENFVLELGAPLRFRLLDAEPKQTAEDFSGNLRRQDWDTTSDYGQVIRKLHIGREDNVANLRAGPLNAFTLGEGRLVERYDNQLSPDYHPLGALLTVNVGPARILAAASDVLAMRLFAGELRLDVGRLATENDKHFDRYHAVASVAHDFGRVGEVQTEPISAVLLGGNAAFYKGDHLQLFVAGGAGTRVGAGTPDLGGFAGLSIRGNTGRVDISGRLEGRYQGGNFRFGLFGPSYELARFSATGLSEAPLAEERMSKNLAGFAELKLGLGSEDDFEALYMAASTAVEHFTIGRTDTDFTLALRFPGARTTATARVIVVGGGTHPRYSVHAELRHRLKDWLYLWGAGGTVHFPQPEGSLARGYTAGAGAGVDFER